MSEMSLSLNVESSSTGDRGLISVVVARLGDIDAHRDSIRLDQASDRRRFIDELLFKIPKMAVDVRIESDQVEVDLLSLAKQARAKRPRFATRKSLTPEPFPVDLLPSVVRQYVTEGAEACYADISIVALPVLVTLAACIGTTRRIAPKTSWTAPAILWGAAVARSGSVKSSGYDLSLALLSADEDRYAQEYDAAMKQFRVQEAEHRKAFQKWNHSSDLSPPPIAPERPIGKRLVVDDQTLEGMVPLMLENPRGLYQLTDELSGFFHGMGAYSSGSRGNKDEARWLAVFGGRPFNVDRKKDRERFYIPNTAVSVFGTIQPGVLANVFSRERVTSGMLARLLLVMPEPRAKRWTDAEIGQVTSRSMLRIADQLKTLEHDIIDGIPKARVITLTDEARQRFIAFVDSHGAETIGHGDALAAAWSKLEDYALRFALVDHLVRWAAGEPNCDSLGPVGIESIEAGIELSRWFANEAERVYHAIGIVTKTEPNARDRNVDRLAEWLHAHGGSATEREISRGPQRYRKGDYAEADCNALIATGRARWAVTSKTRKIVLLKQGDGRDGDTLAEKSEECTEVSPNDAENVATFAATGESINGDTSSEIAGNRLQVSLSPQPVDGGRVRLSL